VLRKTYRENTKSAWLRGTALAALGLWVAAPAMAQEEAEAVSEVVITGSRTIRDGSTAPTPVAVLSIEQLQNASPRNIAEGLAALPALRGSLGNSTVNNAASRNYVGSFMNLRSQGVSRTLTLLDGRRFTPTSVDGSVNFNMMPQSLIKRVDIVTGGASAAYGSDAMTGVVNVILDTDFTGLKGLVQGGISDKGDTGNYKAELSWGARLFDDRLHVLASLGHNRINGMYHLDDRTWARRWAYRLASTVPVSPSRGLNAEDVHHVVYPGGLIVSGGNWPLVNAAFGVSAKTATNQGQGYKFLLDGNGGVVGSPYNVGTVQTPQFQIGGDGTNYIGSGQAMLEDDNAFGRLTFDLTDKTQIFAEAAVSQTQNVYAATASYIQYTSTAAASFNAANGQYSGAGGGVAYTIFEDNPFIPADARARLTSIVPGAVIGGTAVTQAAYDQFRNFCATQADATVTVAPGATPVRCFKMGASERGLPQHFANINSEASNVTVGFKTEIFGDYRLSAYHQRGTSDSTIQGRNAYAIDKLYAAVDAIANPATGGVPGVAAGTPVCRVLITGTAAQKARFAGCAAYNPFGFARGSSEAFNYFIQKPDFSFLLEQNTTAIDFAGEPFDLPAGPLAFAIGAEHRELKVDFDAEPQLELRAANGVRGFPISHIGVQGLFNSSNQQSYSGASKVDEAYAEVNLPLLKDMFLAADLSLNAAARYTDYSLSGAVKTWKVGVSYKPVESVRFRGTLSHDIRAPSVGELFQGNVTAGKNVIDTIILPGATSAIGESRVSGIQRGNSSLKPETANTTSFGVIFTPTWIPGLTVSLDYFNIDISDAILNPDVQDILNQCVAGSAVSCSYIHRAPTGLIQTIETPFQNLQQAQTSGTDMEVSYRRDLGFMPGSISFRTILGYIIDQTTTFPGNPPVSSAGEVAQSSNHASSNPRLRTVTAIGYENGPVRIDATNRYTSHARAENALVEGVTTDINRVNSYSLWDLSGRYKFGEGENLEAFLSINNLFDVDPPRYSSYSLVFGTNPALYDTIGRSYVTGLKFRF